MFAQVIRGRTSDAQGIRSAMDRWTRELAPGSVGWLGSTGGVTDDGRFIAVARFESAAAAARNSARPEQTGWWEQTQQLLDGVTFSDSEDVTVDLQGDPDRAGFVQVMQGRVTDPQRAKELMGQIPSEEMAAYRPDVLGSVMIGQDDGEWTQVIYFTSEAEARAGESKEQPREMQAVMEELMTISKGAPDYLDLREPLLHSPPAGG